jgi:hypothetical protein
VKLGINWKIDISLMTVTALRFSVLWRSFPHRWYLEAYAPLNGDSRSCPNWHEADVGRHDVEKHACLHEVVSIAKLSKQHVVYCAVPLCLIIWLDEWFSH